MKQQSFTPRMRILAGALALSAIIFGAPLGAQAVVPSEGAKILNVVTVTYTDTANNPYAANAAALVTVTLKAAALTVSGPPTAANPGDTNATSCPPTVNSGQTASTMNAVSANANGDDNYTLDFANIVGNDVANESVQFTLYNSAGGVITGPTSGPSTLTNFGSAITLGVKDGTTDTLLFDGGVNLTAMFAIGDIVVVKNGGSKIDYKVKGVSNGTPVSHANNGAGPYTSEGAETAQTYGELQLEAFQVTIDTVTYGSNTTPAFVDGTPGPMSPPAGAIVGEMVLVKVSVTADATSQAGNGTVAFDFTTEDSGGTNTTTDPCTTTFNQAALLSILKEVRNFTDSGAFAAAASGKPGDTLEYKVTVLNPNSSNAETVVVTDAVPEYTTLNQNGYGAGIFATASLNGGAAVNITAVNTDDESATVASGNAPNGAAGQPIVFYLGAGNADTTNTGGILTQNDDVVLLYKVTIDQ